jgi:hypothetical protein
MNGLEQTGPYDAGWDPTGVANAMMSIAGGWYAQSTGAVPFQFAPSQGTYDYLVNYQRVLEGRQIMTGVQSMEAANFNRLWSGTANLLGPRYANDPRFAQFGQIVSGDYGAFASLLGNTAVGRPILSAIGGSRGSPLLASMDFQRSHFGIVDPVTGNLGYSAQTNIDLVNSVQQRFYHPTGAPDPAVRGVRMDDLSGFYGEMRRSGTMVPGSVRTAGMQGSELELRAEEVKRAADTMGQMTDVIRALKDIMGPNAAPAQLAKAMRDLTQNNAAGMNWKEMSQSIRLTEQLAKQSGLGMDQMGMLMGHLGQTAAAEGIDRRSVVPAAQATASFMMAFNATGLSQIRGLDMQKTSLMHGQLTQRAGGSAVAGQLGATMRLADEAGFAEGTEAARLAQAIREGRTTYDNGKSVYVSESEWTQIMQRSGVDAGLAQQIRRQTSPNEKKAFDSGGAEVARRLQRSMDIQPHMVAAMSGILGRTGINGTRANEVANQVANAMFNMTSDQMSQGEEGRIGVIVKALQGAGLNLNEQQARAYAVGLSGAADQVGANLGYGSFKDLYALHSPEVLREAERMKSKTRLHADAAAALSGLGMSSPLQRIVDAMMNATPETNAGDLLKRVLNVVPSEELQKRLTGHQEQISQITAEYEQALAQPGMLDPETKRLTTQGQKVLEEHVQRLKDLIPGLSSTFSELEEEAKRTGGAAAPGSGGVTGPDAGAPGQPTAQGEAGRDLVGGPVRIHGQIRIPGLGDGVLDGEITRGGVGVV